MHLSLIKPEIKKLVDIICLADGVKVDDVLYIIKHGAMKDGKDLGDYEDYEVVFETTNHQFIWWEVREHARKINSREWKIGNNIISFYELTPI